MDRKKVAIVVENLNSFSDKFIELLREADDVELSCVDQDNLKLRAYNFDFVLWHVPPERRIIALDLYSVAIHQGATIFPDLLSLYLFEDKVRQSHFLDNTCSANIVPYYYTDKMDWNNVRETFFEFPFVFKLRSGAGSINVRLVKNRFQLYYLYLTAKFVGFAQVNKWRNLVYVWKKFRSNKIGYHKVIKAIFRLLIPTKRDLEMGREKGYLYGQKFLKDNKGDIRVIVINNKAFGIFRHNRENDFRASGSGLISYDPEDIPTEAIVSAFSLAEECQTVTLACDFLYSDNKELMLVEVSYGWVPSAYIECKGFWEKDTLRFHAGIVEPEKWILESLGILEV